ncbi:4-hydroxyphenylacetate 3-hydroxylase N-terminal domain-containing protein [Paracoccus litorisediminis]|uniref:Uncharacterized protein n=1 Tax=Paracoccus litorisediminis TaxID=2006130 RepID=A0A844HHN6_9RHOB|nr:4-hydroxyphenylacetate 3-hydroxylase N-terminal domain-containing protein [Paracoccus litorisediminis]MTH57705.1 hypothetical protein [Paracoccus litorisediminis]
MIRTGRAYRQSLSNRDILLDGTRVDDVTVDPILGPLVDARARLYDLQHEDASRDILTVTRNGETCAIAARLPVSQADWWAKRRAVDLGLDIRGAVHLPSPVEGMGQIWSLHDAAPMLADLAPEFAENVQTQIARALDQDMFVITATPTTTPPAPHVLRETDAGIVIGGECLAPAAAIANRIAIWGDTSFICDLDRPGLAFRCRLDQARSLIDETRLVFDDVLVPWENVLSHRDPDAARLMADSLPRYAGFGFLQRLLRVADLMIGTVLQSGRDMQDDLLGLALWREGIHAHLTAAVALGQKSPAGLMMPNQSLLHAGRALALSRLTGALPADMSDHPELLAFAQGLTGKDAPEIDMDHGAFAAFLRSFDWDSPVAIAERIAQLDTHVERDLALV